MSSSFHKEAIHITLASDNNYFVGLRAAIISVLYSNIDEIFVFHVLEKDVDKAQIKKLTDGVNQL